MRPPVDRVLKEEKEEFGPGKSSIDQIFALRSILEQSHEWHSPLILNFIDFQKAFDSVDHVALCMEERGTVWHPHIDFQKAFDSVDHVALYMEEHGTV